VGGAIVDEGLKDLLGAVLLPGTADELLKPDHPLGSFSSRIHMAHALGLLNETELADLDLVRKIRNDAAHFEGKRGDGFGTGFSNRVTTERCHSLSVAKALAASSNIPLGSLPVRRVFCVAIAHLMGIILVRRDTFLEVAAKESRAEAFGRILKSAEMGLSESELAAGFAKGGIDLSVAAHQT
jgi:hypothetical protein